MELSEADSKKWLSLLGHRTSTLIGDERSIPPCTDAHIPRRATRQRQTRLTREQVQDLVAGYQSGSTVYELAAQFGCHRKTVSNLLKAHGVTLRMTSMTNEQIAEAIALYESGLSLAKVGVRLGFNDNTVRLRLIECGVRMRDSHGRDRTVD